VHFMISIVLVYVFIVLIS